VSIVSLLSFFSLSYIIACAGAKTVKQLNSKCTQFIITHRDQTHSFYSISDWKKVPELANNTNATYTREHGTQLNESEYTPVFVAMLALMHVVNADAGQAPSMMFYSSLAYTVASAFLGFPFYVPAAMARYGAFGLGLKKILDAKNF